MNITVNTHRAGEIIHKFIKTYPHHKQTPRNIIHIYSDYHKRNKIGQVTIEDMIGKEGVVYKITVTGKEVVKDTIRRRLFT